MGLRAEATGRLLCRFKAAAGAMPRLESRSFLFGRVCEDDAPPGETAGGNSSIAG